jgi:hypothetical protein
VMGRAARQYIQQIAGFPGNIDQRISIYLRASSSKQ